MYRSVKKDIIVEEWSGPIPRSAGGVYGMVSLPCAKWPGVDSVDLLLAWQSNNVGHLLSAIMKSIHQGDVHCVKMNSI